ncbi:hypothetical protein Hanom_Chr09g00869671 [Helianthus anomalus]
MYRRDSFITHRAFCDALAEESARAITGITNPTATLPGQIPTHFNDHLLLDPVHTSFLKKEESPLFPSWLQTQTQSQDQDCSPSSTSTSHGGCGPTLISYHPAPSAYMSATALLQKAAQMGTSHLSRGTTLQAPCTTSFGPHLHQHIAHVSANSPAAAGNNTCGTTGSSSLLNNNNNGACAGGPSSLPLPLPLPQPLPHHPSSSSFIHPVNMSMMTMMMNEDSFADVSPFDDAFSQMLDAKKEEEDDDDNGNDLNECHMMMHGSKSGNGGNIGSGVRGNEGMTRDFLGLKDPSHDGDIVSIDHTLKQPWHHAK